MRDASDRDQPRVAPKVGILDDARALQGGQERGEQFPQWRGGNRIERRAPLRIAGERIDVIEVFQVVVFCLGALLEREQGRRLERKHRQGATPKIGQFVFGIRASLIRDLGEF